jgi:hypothetical protein
VISSRQVLELPQVCTRDGAVLACEDEDAEFYRGGPPNNAALSGTAGALTDPADSSNPAANALVSGDASVPAMADGDIGTRQEYVNQGWTDPAVSLGGPAPTWHPALAPVASGSMPPLLSNLAATGRAPALVPSSSPWMIPPSYRYGVPAGAPMMGPGRPFPLR